MEPERRDLHDFARDVLNEKSSARFNAAPPAQARIEGATVATPMKSSSFEAPKGRPKAQLSPLSGKVEMYCWANGVPSKIWLSLVSGPVEIEP